MGKIETVKIKQGDVLMINFNPTKGREQSGIRPAVVVSGEAFHFSQMMLVCPLTTKIKSFVGDPILNHNKINGLSEISEVLVGQIRSISIGRAIKKLGSVACGDLRNIFQGLDLVCDR